MKISILMEDTRTQKKLFKELGLSLLIEACNKTVLLDTGRGEKFADNARIMGIDLTRLDACVISHAHFDHGGGLARFFEINKETPVFLHETGAKEYYANITAKLPVPLSAALYPFIGHSRRLSKNIGLDPRVLSRFADRIFMISKPTRICDNIHVITDIAKTHPMPVGNKFLLSRSGTKMVSDQFHHEMILAIKEPDGVVLFSGCCHSGILNMIDRVNEYFDNLPIKAVVGGFHLVLQPGKDRMSQSRKDITDLADAIIKKGVQKIFTGHCTGKEAFEVLSHRLKDRICHLSTGTVFNL